MRPTALAVLLLIFQFSIPDASFAQGWREFVSKEDLFAAKFPGRPTVMPIKWETEYGASIPGRIYTVKQGPNSYSMTVVDYSPVQGILTAKSKGCPEGLERCDGKTAFDGPGYWKVDVRGAMIHVVFQMVQRDGKVIEYKWNYLPRGLEVYELQLLNNADKSRTFASIFMHHNRLYVMEATVPQNAPPPALFQQSIVPIEADGKSARHEHVVFNGTEVDPKEHFIFRYADRGSLSTEDPLWHQYVYKEDRFSVNFPTGTDPVITPIAWETEYGASLPARVYSVKKESSTYSVTVVDYNPVKEILTSKSKQCPPGRDPCNRWTSFSGPGYWKNDVRGAMVYAASRFLKRDAKFTSYMWNYLGAVGLEIHELQFQNNADKSRTYAAIYMTDNRLYITEGNSPESDPPPILFQHALFFFDPDGRETSHGFVYFNGAMVDPNETSAGEKGPAAPPVPPQRVYFTPNPR